MTAQIFLQENKHPENLDILANATVTPKGTFCTTKKIYEMTPRFVPSPHTGIRDVAIGAGTTAILGTAWVMVLAKFFFCMTSQDWRNNFGTSGFQCMADTFEFGDSRFRTIQYLFASATALFGIGIYATASYLLRDKTNAARYAELDEVYTGMARQLIELSRAQTPEQKENVMQLARKIDADKNLIQISLQQVVKLQEMQAKCLSEKIAAASQSILPARG